MKAWRLSVGRLKQWLGILSVVVVPVFAGTGVEARPMPQGIGMVALQALPVEAQQTQRLILAGGPFPYQKDGAVFGNRERVLPRRERGFYREYTVRTPGARNRGARRIICGGHVPTQPEACFFTADHYASFQRIAP